MGQGSRGGAGGVRRGGQGVGWGGLPAPRERGSAGAHVMIACTHARACSLPRIMPHLGAAWVLQVPSQRVMRPRWAATHTRCIFFSFSLPLSTNEEATVGRDPLASARIQLNGHDRFSERALQGAQADTRACSHTHARSHTVGRCRRTGRDTRIPLQPGAPGTPGALHRHAPHAPHPPHACTPPQPCTHPTPGTHPTRATARTPCTHPLRQELV